MYQVAGGVEQICRSDKSGERAVADDGGRARGMGGCKAGQAQQ